MMITKYQRVTLKSDRGNGGFYDKKENVKRFMSDYSNYGGVQRLDTAGYWIDLDKDELK
jgi:hypothetical protein